MKIGLVRPDEVNKKIGLQFSSFRWLVGQSVGWLVGQLVSQVDTHFVSYLML